MCSLQNKEVLFQEIIVTMLKKTLEDTGFHILEQCDWLKISAGYLKGEVEGKKCLLEKY